MFEPIQAFEEYLDGDGKSPKTLESYLGDVEEFMKYLAVQSVTDASQIRRNHVTAFRNSLLARELKPATVNKKINSLSCFCMFLREKCILPQSENPVVPKKDRVKIAFGSDTSVSIFTEEELAKLLNRIADKKKVSLRNRLVLFLLLYTGARVSEIGGIKIKDIDPVTSELEILGKGDKYRTVPLRAEVLELAREYIKTDRQESVFRDSPYLILSQRSPRLHRDAFNTLLEKLSEDLDFKCNPHKFRHTYCSRLVKKKVPLTTVAKLAGHASVQTTAAFYVNTSRQDKRDAVDLL